MYDYIGKKLQKNTSSSFQIFWNLKTQGLMPLLVTLREITCILCKRVPDRIFEACSILGI